MTDPSNPTYQVARTTAEPEVAPDHPFQPPEAGAVPCWHEVMTLEDGHIVRCNLAARYHPPAERGAINRLWDRTDSP